MKSVHGIGSMASMEFIAGSLFSFDVSTRVI